MSEIFELWPQGAPGAVGNEAQDRPTLEVFLPAKSHAERAGVVVCPGGGYGFLADDHEGTQVAHWLNERGFAAFVLRYRIAPRYKATFVDNVPVQLLDARRALRLARLRAGEWNVDENKIGVWGFSAGGHLAALASTHIDDSIEKVSSRPDFSILSYPVIALDGVSAYSGSRINLLGDKVCAETVRHYSPQHNVSATTPPAFLFHTADDDVVPFQNSVLYFEALQKQHVASALHIFPHGEHGVGLAQSNEQLKMWPELLETWLTHILPTL